MVPKWLRAPPLQALVQWLGLNIPSSRAVARSERRLARERAQLEDMPGCIRCAHESLRP